MSERYTEKADQALRLAAEAAASARIQRMAARFSSSARRDTSRA